MKKIAFFGLDYHHNGKETARLLADSVRTLLEDRNLSAHFINLNSIIFDISNQDIRVIDGETKIDIREFSAALMTNWFAGGSLLDDVAHSLALYLKANDIPMTSTEVLNYRSTSKLSQMMRAALSEVRIARTVFCPNINILRSYLTDINMPCPFIFKKARASRGNGNYLLEGVDDIMNYASEHNGSEVFIVQEHIVSDHSDYRMFVVNGRVRQIIHRIGSENSHLHNTSAGADTEVLAITDVSSEMLVIAEKMSLALHRELTGLDIIVDKDTGLSYFLEANPVPQIATGSNVEIKLEALAQGLTELAKASD